VSHDYVVKIGKRNTAIMCNDTVMSSIRVEFDGYYDGLLDRMWSYAKMSGIKEREKLF
jgi:hypothetical protein